MSSQQSTTSSVGSVERLVGDISSSSDDSDSYSSDCDSDDTMDEQSRETPDCTTEDQNVINSSARSLLNKQSGLHSLCVNSSITDELQIDSDSDSLSSDASSVVAPQPGSTQPLSDSTNVQNVDSPRTKLRQLKVSMFGESDDSSDDESGVLKSRNSTVKVGSPELVLSENSNDGNSSGDASEMSQKSVASRLSKNRNLPATAESCDLVLSEDSSDSYDENADNSSDTIIDSQHVTDSAQERKPQSPLSPVSVRYSDESDDEEDGMNDEDDSSDNEDDNNDDNPEQSKKDKQTVDTSAKGDKNGKTQDIIDGATSLLNESAPSPQISSSPSNKSPLSSAKGQNKFSDDSTSSEESHDKFSAMRAYIKAKNASASVEETEESEKSTELSKSESSGKTTLLKNGLVSDSESDSDDVVFVGKYDPNKDAPMVVVSDTDSDPDVVVVRTELKRKHKGVGKSSSNSSTDNVKLESHSTEGLKKQPETKPASSRSDAVLSDNKNAGSTDKSDDFSTISSSNNLVYPNILPSDNCLCDVFGAGAFGCKTHSSTGKSNFLSQSLDNLANRVDKSTAQDPIQASSSASTEDTSPGGCVKSPVDTIGVDISDKAAVERLAAAADRSQQRPSPILDMPTDFSSYVNQSGISSNDQSISAVPGDPELPKFAKQSRTMSMDAMETGSSGSHQELCRSQSMPGSNQNLKRRKPTDSPHLRKRNFFQDKYKRLTKLVNVCAMCIEETLPKNLAYCMGEHSWCKQCLERHVTDLLANEKGSLKCGIAGCDSFFSKAQLVKVLPPMVVDVLEAKMDKETVSQVDQDLGDDQSLLDQLVDSLPPGDNLLDEDDNRMDSQGLPITWEAMNDSLSYILCDVKVGSLEALKIVTLFYESMHFPRAKITKISRIQNPHLWQFYCVKKRQMANELGEEINERQLFHGTKANVINAICKGNFDWRLCGTNGTAYGQGSYFAREAVYSHRYTDHYHRPSPAPLRLLPGIAVSPWLPPPPAHMHRHSRSAKQQRLFATLNQLSGVSLSSSLPSNTPVSASWSMPSSSGSSLSSLFTQIMYGHTSSTGGNTTNQSLAGPSGSNSTNSSSTTNPSYAGTGFSPANTITTCDIANQITSGSIGSIGSIGSQSGASSSAQGSQFSQVGSAFTPLQNNNPANPGPVTRRLFSYAPGFAPQRPDQRQQPSSQSQRSSIVSTSTPVQVSTVSSGGNQYKPLFPSIPPYAHSSTQTAPLQVPLPAPSPNPGSSTQQVAPSGDETRVHKMFVARVLCGNSALGAPSYRKPPPINRDLPYGACYDSCVDNALSPNIYVIFDNAQCYPEYLIEYTNKTSSLQP